MQNKDEINLVVFGGGRGASTIISALQKHEQVSLTVLVNAYDDGLSTGRLRKFIPGMLGPSDVRKNIGTLMRSDESCYTSLKDILDYRFNDNTSREEAFVTLNALVNMSSDDLRKNIMVYENYVNLNINQAEAVAKYCKKFIEFEEQEYEKNNAFDYGDCSLGNIIYSGCYLDENHDFNKTILTYSKFCESKGVVHNLTNGENYVLCAIKEDGQIFFDESSIVAPQSNSYIEEIYLLDDYLSDKEVQRVIKLSKKDCKEYFTSIHKMPAANKESLDLLKNADLIIYGPGTQNSSLLPSYLTEGIAEAIQSNKNSEKIFVSNLIHDHDIQGKRVNELVDDFVYNMSRKGSCPVSVKDLVTKIFIQTPDEENVNSIDEADHLPFDFSELERHTVYAQDWQQGDGSHSGGQIAAEMLSIVEHLVEKKVTPHRFMVSIVIPVLNESKFIDSVLTELNLLSLKSLNINKEIILVDGGSTDKTVELAKNHKDIKIYTLDNCKGRGDAIRFGINKARGNVVALFPGDKEYTVNDIIKVIRPIVNNQFGIVFGSRMFKCINLNKQIKTIYGENNYTGYLFSKYGGMLLSVMSLLLYNRFVTDPFSTLKAFDSSLLKNMKLISHGVDLETEIIAKASRMEEFILEIPVDYKARSKIDGKKTTTFGGIKAIYSLLAWKFRKFTQ
jgi:2-phospho-L-lactate transferase/gluconeogenesis factor (CofD/UPF0052 family)